MASKNTTLGILAKAKLDMSKRHQAEQDALLTTHASESSDLDGAIEWVTAQIEVVAAPPLPTAGPTLGAS